MDSTIETMAAREPPEETTSPSKTPKNRSFSDPPTANTPCTLAPSPTFRERIHPQSKDDHALPTTPKPKSPRLTRGLSIQMPPRLSMPSPSHFPSTNWPHPAPLSPQLDQHNIYMQHNHSLSASPAASLPRHSRGLDWSRACTNLHHSTIAEQSSPDSSPVITQKGMMIPSRSNSGRKGSISSMMMLDSPNPLVNGSGSVPWGSLAHERSTLSSSVGSVNMLASGSERSDSDEDASMAGDDNDDPIFTTPQVRKLQNPNAPTPFHGPVTPGGGATWGSGSHFSPAQTSLMKTIRRSRLQKDGKKRNRKSSSSASGSGYSSMASPRATSPPPLRSIESASNSGYFNGRMTAARSRRESLALGTEVLHLSSGNDSGDEASRQDTPSTPGVVRRPVVRRGNLLPKTKGFARIRAALMEEAAPIDSEVRREAETIRQVRERDGSLAELDLTGVERPLTSTGDSSPSLLPAVPEAIQDDFGRDLDSEQSNGNTGPKGLGMNFANHASRNSGGMDYWNRFDPSLRTPPPPSFPRQGSSVMSDINMDSSESNSILGTPLWRRPRARSSASDASEALGSSQHPGSTQQAAPVTDDMHLNRFKRRREDDFDISTIKRRAVSPGMSTQNSPVLTQSPTLKDTSNWGQPPERKDKSQPASACSEISQASQLPPAATGSRHGSGGSTISMASATTATGAMTPTMSNGGKKLGLQGMVDTNNELMKMSIE